MGIAQKVAREFGDSVRARGQSYFAKGRVRIISVKPNEVVVAKVRGTESYKVKMRMRAGRLHASCSCPYFEPNGIPCKHLWATILAVDSQNLIATPEMRPLRLISDPPTPSRRPGPPDGEGQPIVRDDDRGYDGFGSEGGGFAPNDNDGRGQSDIRNDTRGPGDLRNDGRGQGPPRNDGRGPSDFRNNDGRGQGYGPGQQAYGQGPGPGTGPSSSGYDQNIRPLPDQDRPLPLYPIDDIYAPGFDPYGASLTPPRPDDGRPPPRGRANNNPPPPPQQRRDQDRDRGPNAPSRYPNGRPPQDQGRPPRQGQGQGQPPYQGQGQPPYQGQQPYHQGQGQPPYGMVGQGPMPQGYPQGRGPGPNGPPNNRRQKDNRRGDDQRPNGGPPQGSGPRQGYPNNGPPQGYPNNGPPQGYPNNGPPQGYPSRPRQGYGPGGPVPGSGGYGPNSQQRQAYGPNGQQRQAYGPGNGQAPPHRPGERPRLPGPNGPIGPGMPLGPNGRPTLKQRKLERDARKLTKLKVVPKRNIKRLLAYIIDVPTMINQGQVVIDLARRERRTTGEWGPLRPWWHAPTGPPNRYDPEDHELLEFLNESQSPPPAETTITLASTAENPGTRRFSIPPERHAAVIERLAKVGRLRLRRAEGEEDPPTARWDDGSPWRFVVDVKAEPGGKRWTWRGGLRRREDRMDLAEPLALQADLLVLGSGRVARFDDSGVPLWVARLRHEKELVLTDPQQDIMLGKLLAESRVPAYDLIETLELEEIDCLPRPCLTLRTPRQNWGGPERLLGELAFEYDHALVPIDRPGTVVVETDRGVLIRRNVPAEQKAAIQLFEVGFRESKDHHHEPGTLELPPKRMGAVTRELVQAGWKVEAEGQLIRPASEFKLAVSTGIDWFELGGAVDFGGQSVPLPDLLAAVSRGETMIELGDGSMGMLPEEWIKKYGNLLVELSSTTEDGLLRFAKAQAGLLDALLAAQPEIKVDAAFSKVRESLRKFEGLTPKDAPAGFRGELRPYQQEGLGWLEYLQKFEFGGILADDMGLGKTIQVLAHLQSRRTRRLSKGPSLIVVPRSLVFNWIQEAERFTPRLRVLDYTGPNRHALREEFCNHDLIVTTYGTLRTDIIELGKIEFDYLILDEAQAIKNAESQAAKAARLLKGRYRLAMSGTPIENHIGELWSIFEFLNPGMLGPGSAFKRFTGGTSATDEGSRTLLAKALKPFILRRTKKEVVKDLPDKIEQTLSCDMEPAQRQLYEELLAHYRGALLRKGSKEITASKIEVLEALLRLRQASCHPGLIDPTRVGDPSAKLDMLLPQLIEVVEEGHKVLIFSQFTSFLAIVRDRLDTEGLKYEYLDGSTRDRAARVERFQTDPEVPIFLISLKAGGLGLNLTSAEYVYLLDPWWNPAVEAQAIDRSHRIGQTRSVFAYRLICRDTVEQKILDLQQRKRELADSILDGDGRLIANLTKDDLEFLLS